MSSRRWETRPKPHTDQNNDRARDQNFTFGFSDVPGGVPAGISPLPHMGQCFYPGALTVENGGKPI